MMTINYSHEKQVTHFLFLGTMHKHSHLLILFTTDLINPKLVGNVFRLKLYLAVSQ